MSTYEVSLDGSALRLVGLPSIPFVVYSGLYIPEEYDEQTCITIKPVLGKVKAQFRKSFFHPVPLTDTSGVKTESEWAELAWNLLVARASKKVTPFVEGQINHGQPPFPIILGSSETFIRPRQSEFKLELKNE